jgi:mannose-6-phosphate isomerase-like protein (cupin superfamily)
MQVPRLAELAKELFKTKQCRFILPGATQASAFDHKPQAPDGRNIDEVFQRIEEPGSWIALYNVETDPAYAGFLKEVTDSARALIEPEQTGLFNIGGFIFISAPPSITPFHIDRENNLWLQVRGRKIMNVWDHTDRHVVSARDVDHFIVTGSLETVRLQDGYRERSHEFNVGPGDGVYFPSTSPHMTRTTNDWVSPGDGISISIGVVFYSKHTYRHANIHALNAVLRRFGMQPSQPGKNATLDAIKFRLGRALVWARRRFRGYQPPAGIDLPG